MKDIEGYEGLYAATRDGRIWCFPRQWIGNARGKQCVQKRKGKFLKGYFKPDRYILVSLVKDKTATTFSVHRIIAKVFIPNPNNLPQVNHKNGIKTDNRVENLEWCTPQNNILHGQKLGLINSNPEFHNMTKLSAKEVREIRTQRHKSPSQLAKKYGVTRGSIHNIWTKKTWKKLS